MALSHFFELIQKNITEDIFLQFVVSIWRTNNKDGPSIVASFFILYICEYLLLLFHYCCTDNRILVIDSLFYQKYGSVHEMSVRIAFTHFECRRSPIPDI